MSWEGGSSWSTGLGGCEERRNTGMREGIAEGGAVVEEVCEEGGAEEEEVEEVGTEEEAEVEVEEEESFPGEIDFAGEVDLPVDDVASFVDDDVAREDVGCAERGRSSGPCAKSSFFGVSFFLGLTLLLAACAVPVVACVLTSCDVAVVVEEVAATSLLVVVLPAVLVVRFGEVVVVVVFFFVAGFVVVVEVVE